MNMPPIVSPQEWESAREELLVKEKELTRARIASEYIEHYNTERPHRGLGLQPPNPQPRLVAGPIERHDRLGGLIHHYERSAA